MFLRIIDFIRLVLPHTIKSQMILMVSVLAGFQILITAIAFESMLIAQLESGIGQKALNTSKTLALMPNVRDALVNDDNIADIQELAESVRRETGAAFVVVGNRDGIRLSHPNPDNIGKIFVGGDFETAVRKGKAYTSVSTGTLGRSLRGFAPVKNTAGEIVGFVSVGYLERNITKAVMREQIKVGSYIFMILFSGALGASLIAAYIKRVTLNMEPSEIASLHLEREIILNAVREGIIALDKKGSVRFANREAERLLQVGSQLEGQSIREILPEIKPELYLANNETVRDKEILIRNQGMIFNMHTVGTGDKKFGLVASFRRKDEIDYLNQELSVINQTSDLLRVQSHEYSNKLHTIGGLLQIEEYEEAKTLILKESYLFHDLMEYLDEKVNCPLVNGMLIGKFNKAGELKCRLEFDFNGSWLSSPSFPEHLVTVLGNLIDNAIEAALGSKALEPVVRVALSEDDKTFFASIEDNGPGIPEDLDIFRKGVSSKAEGRGIGLYNVVTSLEVMSGTIRQKDTGHDGTCFNIQIPKIGS